MTNSSHVYPPRLSRIWGAGLLFMSAGLIAAWKSSKAYWLWFHGGATLPPLPSYIVAVLGYCCIAMGIWAIVGALRGLPQLAIGPYGIRLATACGTQWAAWDSLTNFELEVARVGILRRRISSATARVVGPMASDKLLDKKLFVIPDIFAVPIPAIVADLNERNPHAPAMSSNVCADGMSRQEFGLAGFKAPWMTFGILAVLILVFALEQVFAVEPAGPGRQAGIRTLLALGGLNRSLMMSTAEWYRLFTAPLLHLNLLHLVFNSVALLIAGLFSSQWSDASGFLRCLHSVLLVAR
jgi:hypothetical protein